MKPNSSPALSILGSGRAHLTGPASQTLLADQVKCLLELAVGPGCVTCPRLALTIKGKISE